MTVAIRKASREDARDLATLARAFADDPVMAWLLPSARARTERLPRLFAMELFYLYLPHDEVYTECDLVGGAVWRRRAPGGHRRAASCGPSPAWPGPSGPTCRLRSNASSAIERVHPRQPHWYLAVVGTEPSHQRQGIGSALLAPVLERCDRRRPRVSRVL